MASIHASSTYLLYNPEHKKLHLWIALTDPEGDSEMFVAVMVVSKQRFTDPTVILDSGDHPFIKHPSSIQFGTANYFYNKNIQRKIKKGFGNFQPDLSEDVFDRIRVGLPQSPWSVPSITNYCATRL